MPRAFLKKKRLMFDFNNYVARKKNGNCPEALALL